MLDLLLISLTMPSPQSEASLISAPLSKFRLAAIRTVTAIVFGLALILIANNAKNYSLTYDEPFHIDWNQRLLYDGISERSSVYNYISTTPIIALNVIFADLVTAIAPEFQKYRLFLLRIFTLFWFILLIVFTYLLSRRFMTHEWACLPVLALSCEPSILSHSSLVSTDIPFATCVVALLYFLLNLKDNLCLRNSLITGLAFGLTLVTKFSSFLLVPLIFAIPLVQPSKTLLSRAFWKSYIRYLLVLALGSVLIISIFYNFIGFATPLSDFVFYDPFFQELQRLVPSLRLPLPADFITAYDHLSQAGKRQEWNVVLFGNWYGQGTPYYFVALALLKTPLPLLLLSFLGIYYFFKTQTKRLNIEVAVLVAIAVFLIGYFSLFVKVQVGYRYILMALPLLAIGLSWGLSRRFSPLLCIGVAVLSLLELAPYRDNMISFSNSLIWDKRQAYRWLADSNIDWGQNRWRSPAVANAPVVDPPHILPGENVFSLNVLTGVFWNFKQHAWVREKLIPVGHIRHTWLVFNVPPEQFIDFLIQERSLTAKSERECPTTIDLDPQDNITISSTELKGGSCLKTKTSSLLRLEITSGSGLIGEVNTSKKCSGLMVKEGDPLWFYLPKAASYKICTAPKSKEFQIRASLVSPRK